MFVAFDHVFVALDQKFVAFDHMFVAFDQNARPLIRYSWSLTRSRV